MKGHLPAFLIAVAALVAFATWHTIKKNRTAKKEYEIFYHSHVEGTLKSISISLGTTYVTIDGGKEFQFWVYTSTPGNKIFDRVADVSDSVRKAPRSDTLYLFKEDVVYAFTFAKFD